MGLLRRDPEGITKALRQVGFHARDGQQDVVADLIYRVHEGVLQNLNLDAFRLQDLNAESVLEAKLDAPAMFRRLGLTISDLTDTFQVPKDWILLQRTLVLLVGLCTHLDPAMQPMRTIRPYLESFVLGPEKDWQTLAGAMIKDVVLSALSLPGEMRQLLHRANRGELEVRVRGSPERTRLLNALGHQLLYGLFALGTGMLGYVAHLHQDASLALALAGASGFFLLWVGGSMLRARRWQRRRS